MLQRVLTRSDWRCHITYHTRWAIEDTLTHTLPHYGLNGTANETINFSPVVYNAKVDQLPPLSAGWGQTPHYKSTLRYINHSDLPVECNASFPLWRSLGLALTSRNSNDLLIRLIQAGVARVYSSRRQNFLQGRLVAVSVVLAELSRCSWLL